jgi:hypothetical protein
VETDQTENNKEQPLVDKQQLAPSQAKLTRNHHHKRSFFRRRRSSDDVWQKTLSATMTTLAAPTSTAPQQPNPETQPDANAASQTAGKL